MKITSSNFLTKRTHFVGTKDCLYTINGKNLTELRRAELSATAKALGIDVNTPKNEMVSSVIDKANSLDLPYELTEIQEKPKKKRKKSAK